MQTSSQKRLPDMPSPRIPAVDESPRGLQEKKRQPMETARQYTISIAGFVIQQGTFGFFIRSEKLPPSAPAKDCQKVMAGNHRTSEKSAPWCLFRHHPSATVQVLLPRWKTTWASPREWITVDVRNSGHDRK